MNPRNLRIRNQAVLIIVSDHGFGLFQLNRGASAQGGQVQVTAVLAEVIREKIKFAS